MEKGPKSPETRAEVDAAVAEVDLYSVLIKTMDRWAPNRERWETGDPKELIDEMVAKLPKAPRIVSRDASDEELSWQPPPTDIEAYILHRVMLDDHEAFFMEDAEGAPGSFPVSESIRCMRDYERTRRFIRSIDRAITRLEGEGDVEVLDAGTGAIPIMGLYAALASEKARVTCLELNPHAARFARSVIKSFGLTDRVSVYEEDATRYRYDRPIDLLISETMNTGLISEPLTRIMEAQAPRVRTGGIMLPSRVETFAATVPTDAYDNAPEYAQIYGTPRPHLELPWTLTSAWQPHDVLRRIEADIPAGAVPEERYMLLASRVELYGESLELYDSIISMPQPVSKIAGGKEVPRSFHTNGDPLHLSYAPGDDPDLVSVR